MYGVECEEVDAFIASHKTMRGYLPVWKQHFRRQHQSRWGIVDVNDIESGELCLTIGHDWKHASIVCTHRQRMIYRLCIAPLTECKPNHHNAWEQNLPHEVCGPHVHGWPENRAYVMVNGFDQLPVRRAINGLVETIKDAVGWAATDLNILIAPDQRDFNYPVQELV